MGDGQGRAGDDGSWLFEPEYNRAIKLRQADPRITSNAGAFLLREVDHRLGLTAALAAQLSDRRRPDRICYEQVELLRQHLYALALGYAHQDDQDILAHDPALKLAVWDRFGGRGLHERLASQPTDYRLLDRLATPGNRRALRAALSEWVGRHQRAAGRGRKVTHGTPLLRSALLEVVAHGEVHTADPCAGVYGRRWKSRRRRISSTSPSGRPRASAIAIGAVSRSARS